MSSDEDKRRQREEAMRQSQEALRAKRRESADRDRQRAAGQGLVELRDASYPPAELARGLVDATTLMYIYDDGTYAFGGGLFSRPGRPDLLLAFDHDADSMRRKSATGRGAAALLTGGASLLASNNRGVVYVTLLGKQAGTRTFTTRNPSGTQLTGIRSLKAAADHVLEERKALADAPPPRQNEVPAAGGAAGADLAAQLRQLGELHTSGVLSDEEFAAAKGRLLDF